MNFYTALQRDLINVLEKNSGNQLLKKCQKNLKVTGLNYHLYPNYSNHSRELKILISICQEEEGPRRVNSGNQKSLITYYSLYTSVIKRITITYCFHCIKLCGRLQIKFARIVKINLFPIFIKAYCEINKTYPLALFILAYYICVNINTSIGINNTVLELQLFDLIVICVSSV